MFRISKVNDKYLAIEIETVEESAEDIATLANQGDPVLIVDEIDSVEYWGIDADEVQILEN